ncbi:TIGR04372 family glycosyltransferase [Patescibacteria group bacterium]|nr:TIGR04372 family glycosyltransferase [Patescibacteria group bacterium]
MAFAKEIPNHAQAFHWSKVTRFLTRQAKQMRSGGWPVFWRKFLKLFHLLLMLPFALPVVLLIRLLRPFIVIRFGQLVSHRIGHFAGNTEVYLCERDAGINVPRQSFMDIWYHMPSITNLQLKKMWGRILHIWPAILAEPTDRLSRFLPGRNAHMVTWRDDQPRDVHNVLERFPPHLSFLPEEDHQGQDSLKILGVPGNAPFVCFHARDSAYLKTIYDHFDTSYHDYRDSNINNYVPAAEELTRRGYYAIRMGSIVTEALNVSNPRIIDYAANGYRTDFMDIYLGAKCAFFISSGTGIDSIPEIFRRPYMFVNLVPLERAHTWNATHVFIPKKHWLRNERRFMTFREILDSSTGRFMYTQQFEQHGIELIEDTPEEIMALAIEMDERLKGTWRTTKEDEELQRRFWALYKPSELHGKIKSRVGADFLRQHFDWLE